MMESEVWTACIYFYNLVFAFNTDTEFCTE